MTEVSYAIEVPVKEFLSLEDRENKDFSRPSLCEDLNKIEGVREVNYNGHFGAFIFVKIECEFDNKETKNLIAVKIARHLNRK